MPKKFPVSLSSTIIVVVNGAVLLLALAFLLRERLRDGGTSGEPSGGATLDPRGEQALALKALKKLELQAPRAKALLRQVLAEQPALREAEATELVRAVLVRC